MNNIKIIFDQFELPFINSNDKKHDDDEYADNLNIEDLKQLMEAFIPDSAIDIGVIEYDVEDNLTTGRIYDQYYIIPLENENFDWALFRLSWDDNFEKWTWCFDARIIGYKENHLEAARIAIQKLWDYWNIDLIEIENAPYKDLLNSLS
jgi:hypothetical protein